MVGGKKPIKLRESTRENTACRVQEELGGGKSGTVVEVPFWKLKQGKSILAFSLRDSGVMESRRREGRGREG